MEEEALETNERRAAIELVADDRRAHVREVCAHLVHAAGLRGAAHERVGGRRLLDGEGRQPPAGFTGSR